jgi:hypothetical protein
MEETFFDGSTLTVRLPMRLVRTRARKRILAPDGAELAPPTRQQPDAVLIKALARAWRWQRMLDEGGYASIGELAAAEGISKSYVARLLRLANLAPDIVETILTGKLGPSVGLEQLMQPLPMSWKEQRALLAAWIANPATERPQP